MGKAEMPQSDQSECCPHVDLEDPRCAGNFTLGGVEGLFQYCCGGYHACALFHRINMERNFRRTVGSERAEQFFQQRRVPAATQVTAHGRPLGIRATGS